MVVWDGIKPYLKKNTDLVAQEEIKLEGWGAPRHWNTENQGHFSQHLMMGRHEMCWPLCHDGPGRTGIPSRVQASAETQEQTVPLSLQGWTGPWHAPMEYHRGGTAPACDFSDIITKMARSRSGAHASEWHWKLGKDSGKNEKIIPGLEIILSERQMEYDLFSLSGF